MIEKRNMKGHLFALISIIIWGTTFISTKILLRSFSPVEILFYRFSIGILALLVTYPHRLKKTTFKQELLFAGAGFCGIMLYFLLENIALLYTTASNVGIIISVAPFFTGLLSFKVLDGEKPTKDFFIGFVIAMTGITLISINKTTGLTLSPVGDLLAVSAAIVWAVYSILVRKISKLGYNTIQTTRRIFFYGLVLMIPVLFTMDFQWGIQRFLQPANLFNILFLGLGASALCFVTWNTAVDLLGAVKTSVYIYIVPVVTVVTSVIVLRETITWSVFFGVILTLGGLLLSERKTSSKSIQQVTTDAGE